MTFSIHRGADEIGGSCVEICSAKARIVIDIGMPLMNRDGSPFDSAKIKELSKEDLIKEKTLPNIPILYDLACDKETALLISHAHLDHYGLIPFVDKKIPVYLGEATHKLIELSGIFTGKESVIENTRYFKSCESFTFGDIEITPYLVDHASFDAYSFLVRVDGKSLLYTGDFRGHGRKGRTFYKFLKIAPKNVDWLLMEGTSLSDINKRHKTEDELETQFVQTFKETDGINMVYLSGQNIDRLVTIFRSCKKCGKLFVIDFYIATVLYELTKLGYRLPYPSPNFSEVRVFFPKYMQKRIENFNKKDLIEQFKKYEITIEEINEKANNIVMTIRQSMDYEIDRIENIAGGNVIYSMWEGYKETPNTEKFLANLMKRGAKIISIHTSGHADCYTLKKLVSTIKPLELIPIHTLEKEKYKEIFSGTNVRKVDNGEIVGD